MNVDHDFDYQHRPAGSAADWGADEVGGVALGGTVAFQSASQGTLGGNTLNFGDIGGNGTRASVVTIEVGYLPVNFQTLIVSYVAAQFSKLRRHLLEPDGQPRQHLLRHGQLPHITVVVPKTGIADRAAQWARQSADTESQSGR